MLQVSSPFRLRSLGGAALWCDTQPAPPEAGRRRLLALLALACSTGDRGISRERLAAAMWPDVNDAHARNDLKQLVFVARRALGCDVFVDHPTALVVNQSVLSSDVDDFHRASRERRHEDVVGLYGGPFLDGFHIANRPELERLAEAERDRCARVYCDALESLAQRAETDGTPGRAAHWWQLLVSIDPVRDDYAMGLMGALADAGELCRALSYAQRYARLVRAELDTDPSPEFVRFVRELPARVGQQPVVTMRERSVGDDRDGGFTATVAVRRTEPPRSKPRFGTPIQSEGRRERV